MSRYFKIAIGVLGFAFVVAATENSPSLEITVIILAVGLVVVYAKKTYSMRRIAAHLTAQPRMGSAPQDRRPDPRVEAAKSRIDAVVSKHVGQVSDNRGSRYRSHYIDDLTCECLREVVNIEPSLRPAPNHGEYLWKWQQRVRNPAAITLAAEIQQKLHQRQQQLEQQLQEEQRISDAAPGQQLLDKHRDVINKFLEIAERKVSQLDDYGDERLDLLPKEVDACVIKIAGREGLVEAQVKERLKAWGTLSLSPTLQWVHSRLSQLFAEYHEQQKSEIRTKDEVSSLSGAEFETYVARVLQQHDWQVSATPTTGDQGADLIASKAERKVVIQAKRYVGSVGNHAVQKEGCHSGKTLRRFGR